MQKKRIIIQIVLWNEQDGQVMTEEAGWAAV